MIKNIDKLADRLKGIKVGDKDLTIDMLKELISGQEEVELVVGDVHLLNNTQIETMKNTVREEQKAISYNEGKTAGIEMTVKNIKRKAGIETEGKDPDKLFEELSAKIEKEKGIEPNKKISELSESINNLQKLAGEKEAEANTWKSKAMEIEKGYKETEEWMGVLPKNMTITNKQFLTLLKAEGYSLDFTDTGDKIPTLNGKPLKDTLEKPIPVDVVVNEFAKKYNFISGQQGRGDGDQSGQGMNTFKTLNDVYAYMEKNNIEPQSDIGVKLQNEFEAKKSA